MKKPAFTFLVLCGAVVLTGGKFPLKPPPKNGIAPFAQPPRPNHLPIVNRAVLRPIPPPSTRSGVGVPNHKERSKELGNRLAALIKDKEHPIRKPTEKQLHELEKRVRDLAHERELFEKQEIKLRGEHKEKQLGELARRLAKLQEEEDRIERRIHIEERLKGLTGRDRRFHERLLTFDLPGDPRSLEMVPCKPAHPTLVTNLLNNDDKWQKHEDCFYNRDYYYHFDQFVKTYNDYPTRHGRKASWGWYYPGRKHEHWAYVGYFPGYESYLHYDPFLEKFFYWSNKAQAYYPVDYVPDGDYE
jgi:hypothetical protein